MESVDLDRVRHDRRPRSADDRTRRTEVPFEFDDSTRHRLLNGLDDIALTLRHEDAIAAYETAHAIA